MRRELNSKGLDGKHSRAVCSVSQKTDKQTCCQLQASFLYPGSWLRSFSHVFILKFSMWINASVAAEATGNLRGDAVSVLRAVQNWWGSQLTQPLRSLPPLRGQGERLSLTSTRWQYNLVLVSQTFSFYFETAAFILYLIYFCMYACICACVTCVLKCACMSVYMYVRDRGQLRLSFRTCCLSSFMSTGSPIGVGLTWVA